MIGIDSVVKLAKFVNLLEPTGLFWSHLDPFADLKNAAFWRNTSLPTLDFAFNLDSIEGQATVGVQPVESVWILREDLGQLGAGSRRNLTCTTRNLDSIHAYLPRGLRVITIEETLGWRSACLNAHNLARWARRARRTRWTLDTRWTRITIVSRRSLWAYLANLTGLSSSTLRTLGTSLTVGTSWTTFTHNTRITSRTIVARRTR